jgi:hypothetical protein
MSVIFEVACKHLLILRECAVDESEIDMTDEQPDDAADE